MQITSIPSTTDNVTAMVRTPPESLSVSPASSADVLHFGDLLFPSKLFIIKGSVSPSLARKSHNPK
jgi:hypothetical protein